MVFGFGKFRLASHGRPKNPITAKFLIRFNNLRNFLQTHTVSWSQEYEFTSTYAALHQRPDPKLAHQHAHLPALAKPARQPGPSPSRIRPPIQVNNFCIRPEAA